MKALVDSSVDQLSDAVLGMEARSILRSIETEHSKLRQSSQIAPSDLHYFTARYNYYRLCLLRLESEERKVLEKTLSSFRAEIFDHESSSQPSDEPQAAPPPFLTPVESHGGARIQPKADVSEVLASTEVSSQSAGSESPGSKFEPSLEAEKSATTSPFKEKLISELSLVSIALAAEASNDRNAVCSQAIDRILQLIKSEL